MVAGVRPSTGFIHAPTSSVAPCLQLSNDGAASSVLRPAARSFRARFDMKALTESAPIDSKGGSTTSGKSAPMSAVCPARSLRSASTDRSTCSRLRAGSQSRPSKRKMSEIAADSAARAPSTSVSQRSERRSSDESTWRSSPASAPGVITRTNDVAENDSRSPFPIPKAASPRSRSLATRAAASATLAAPSMGDGSTQGATDAGSNDGKASSRFGRSPFTSMTSTGTDARNASSTITVTSPVLPLPVIPSTTPCVTR